MEASLRRMFLLLPLLPVLVAAIAAPAGGSATAAKKQYGVSVFVTDTCPRPAADWQVLADNNMRAVKALGANSVGLAFPFYTDNVKSDSVYVANTCPRTNPARVSPTPSRLAVIVRAAHALKLRVVLRPLLDEAGLGNWRGSIVAPNPKAWFASYEQMLAPYLRMAKANKVEQFSIAGELNNMQTTQNWSGVVAFSRRLYSGALVMVPTWPGGPMRHPAGTTLGIDPYPKYPNQKPSATVKQILGRWNSTLASYKLPPGVPLYEVGINAVDGAYAFPSVTTAGKFDQKIQVTWFTAACSFVKQHKLGGIYYWGQWFEANGGNLLAQPNPNAAAQIQPKSQVAIRKCFAH